MSKINHEEAYDENYIADILKKVKTIAMVGASNDKTKFSYGVLRVLHETGYKMFPVNPTPRKVPPPSQTPYNVPDDTVVHVLAFVEYAALPAPTMVRRPFEDLYAIP